MFELLIVENKEKIQYYFVEKIFADKVKYPKLQRAITQDVFFRIDLKVNQVIYSSLPIYSPRFKVLAPTVL